MQRFVLGALCTFGVAGIAHSALAARLVHYLVTLFDPSDSTGGHLTHNILKHIVEQIMSTRFFLL